MSLNIKSDRVHALVRDAAQRTGLSQTSVVEQAVLAYLSGLDARAASARVDELLAVFDQRLTDQDRAEMRAVADDLYDEAGLPR